jgi:hypothetical protein
MHRRYNRQWSRFDQPDPYDGSYSLTDPQSFNRYSYVQNDPVNFVDPTGLNLSSVNCYLSAQVFSRPDNEGGGTISWLDVQWVCVTETWDTGRGGVPVIDDNGGGEPPQKPAPPEELYHCNEKVRTQLEKMWTELSSTKGTREIGFTIGLDFHTNEIRASEIYSSQNRHSINHRALNGTQMLAVVHSHSGGGLHSNGDMRTAVQRAITNYVLPEKWGIPGLALYNGRAPKGEREVKAAPPCP